MCLGRRLLRIAEESGQSLRQVSEATYLIGSAGFRQKEDMVNLLEATALGAKAAMGEMGALADLLTSSLYSYGFSSDRSEHILNTIQKGVFAGKMDAPGLVTTLPRGLDVASKMGVDFEELVAWTAHRSLGGTTPAEAITEIRSALNAFLKPSKEAQEILAGLSITVEELQERIASSGLVDTLNFLWKGIEGNGQAMAALIGKEEALKGVFSVLDDGADRFAETLGHVMDSTNAVSDAAEKMGETTTQKFKELITQLQTIAVDMGDRILPQVRFVIDSVSSLADSFKELSDSSKDGILKVIYGAGGLAALGIAIKVVAFAFSGLIALLALMGAKGAIAIAPVILGATLLYDNWEPVKTFFGGFFASLKEGFSKKYGTELVDEIDNISGSLSSLSEKHSEEVIKRRELGIRIRRDLKLLQEILKEGRDIVAEFGDGFMEMLERIGGGIQSVIDKTKDLLNFFSRSKEDRDAARLAEKMRSQNQYNIDPITPERSESELQNLRREKALEDFIEGFSNRFFCAFADTMTRGWGGDKLLEEPREPIPPKDLFGEGGGGASFLVPALPPAAAYQQASARSYAFNLSDGAIQVNVANGDPDEIARGIGDSLRGQWRQIVEGADSLERA